MKKLLQLATRALVTLALAALSLPAFADVEINETNFPDSNFRDYLKSQNYGQDGIITDEELATITKITISYNSSYKYVRNLQGINYLTALKTIDFLQCSLEEVSISLPNLVDASFSSCHYLTSLDLSCCQNLDYLFCCSNKQLTKLDLTANTKLTELNCGFNSALTELKMPSSLKKLDCGSLKLSSLDLSQMNELDSLDCSDCSNLESLNLNNLAKLTRLAADNCKLSSIDLSRCVSLKEVSIYNNQLNSLNISGIPNLETINCSGNPMETLSIVNCALLEYVDCSGCQISNACFDGDVALRTVDCYKNNLTGDGFDALVASLPIISNGRGTMKIYYEGDETNVITPAQVASAEAKNWYCFSSDDGYYWTLYAGGDIENDVPIDEAHFPDDVLRSWLLEQDFGQDGVISRGEVYDLDISGLGISDLTGLRYFGDISHINCSKNNLTDLKEIRFFPFIYEIDCSGNKLTSLDVSFNEYLETLKCNDNLLSSLDLEKSEHLGNVLAYNNPHLTELILPGVDRYIEYSMFTQLFASNCALTNVKNLETQTELYELALDGNPLRKIDLSGLGQLNYLNIDHCELVALRVNGDAFLEYNAVSRDEDEAQFDELVARTGKLGWASADVYEQGVISPQERSIIVERAGRGNNFINFIWNDDRDTNLEGILGDGFKMSSIVDGTLDGGYLVSPGDVIPDDAPDYVKAIDPSQLEAPIILLDKGAGELVFNVTVTDSEDSDGGGILPGIQPSPRLKDDDETSDTDRFSQMKVVLKWEDPGYVTAIDSLVKTASPAVAVKYYNASGVAADEPFEGLNIVVTTHADGSRTTDKLVR